jgi:hypothetical protein
MPGCSGKIIVPGKCSDSQKTNTEKPLVLTGSFAISRSRTQELLFQNAAEANTKLPRGTLD